MELPLWILCIIIIVIIIVYFVIVQLTAGVRLLLWEKRAEEILDNCGFSHLIKPIVVKSNSVYLIGKCNKEGTLTSATIHLYIGSKFNKFSDENIISSLISKLAYIVLPKAKHNSIAYYEVVEKLSFFSRSKYGIDPFITE